MSGLFDDVMVGIPLAKAFCKGVGKLGKAAVKAGKEVYDSGVIQETAANVGKKISEMDLHIPVCPDCGAKQIPGMKFCPKCGAKLPEKKPTVEAEKAEEAYSYDDENWDDEPAAAAPQVYQVDLGKSQNVPARNAVIHRAASEVQNRNENDEYWEQVRLEDEAQQEEQARQEAQARARREEEEFWDDLHARKKKEREQAAAAFFLMEEENNWEL